eukprot:SM000250S08721  [mRNA]  locus=s250:143179:146655:- [translate_table: standard]
MCSGSSAPPGSGPLTAPRQSGGGFFLLRWAELVGALAAGVPASAPGSLQGNPLAQRVLAAAGLQLPGGLAVGQHEDFDLRSLLGGAPADQPDLVRLLQQTIQQQAVGRNAGGGTLGGGLQDLGPVLTKSSSPSPAVPDPTRPQCEQGRAEAQPPGGQTPVSTAGDGARSPSPPPRAPQVPPGWSISKPFTPHSLVLESLSGNVPGKSMGGASQSVGLFLVRALDVKQWKQPYSGGVPSLPSGLNVKVEDLPAPLPAPILGKRVRDEDEEDSRPGPSGSTPPLSRGGSLKGPDGGGGNQVSQSQAQEQVAAAAAAAAAAANAAAQRPRSRARRGQATDPHSIAERLRRERIAERMKALQELVPNSNKTDKASMLDEIIEYVKFLQLQVKLLSMSRLGATSGVPLLNDLAAEGAGAQGRPTTENLALTERQVALLMEEDMGMAMQYLQSKGLCLVPISLASVISSSPGNAPGNPQLIAKQGGEDQGKEEGVDLGFDDDLDDDL